MTEPRYYAQFRRGYDGPPVPPPLSGAPTTPASNAEPPISPPGSSRPIGLPRDENAGVVDVVVDQEPEPLRRRNPWLIALLVVGLVMLVVGTWLLRAYVTMAAVNGYSSSEQLQVFFEQQLTQALLTSGFIAVIAWLVVGALNVRSRS